MRAPLTGALGLLDRLVRAGREDSIRPEVLGKNTGLTAPARLSVCTVRGTVRVRSPQFRALTRPAQTDYTGGTAELPAKRPEPAQTAFNSKESPPCHSVVVGF